MDINPFQKGKKVVQSEGLEGYQPFQKPAVAATPGIGASATGGADSRRMYEDLEKRQKELDQRAAEIDRREREQSHLLSNGTTTNNFPPIPSICPFKPCFYQDIDIEIPPQYINVVTRGYHLWISMCGILILNLCASLGYIITDAYSPMAGTTFGTAIVVLIIFPPASYVCWFRPLYNAFKSDSSINFFIFFFIMFIQIIVTIIQALGIYWLSSCGWVNGLMMLRHNRIAGGIMIITAIGFTVISIFEVIFLIKVHRLYRNTDASFEKAKSEFGTSAASTVISASRYSATSQ